MLAVRVDCYHVKEIEVRSLDIQQKRMSSVFCCRVCVVVFGSPVQLRSM